MKKLCTGNAILLLSVPLFMSFTACNGDNGVEDDAYVDIGDDADAGADQDVLPDTDIDIDSDTNTDTETDTEVSDEDFGPRGPRGPDVPLTYAEEAYFSERVTVDGSTAEAVQAACDRAKDEGIPVVFLPAREYEFESTVDVPAGVTILGEGAASYIRTMTRSTKLFAVDGDDVRFTRLKLQGADTTQSSDNDTHGISVSGNQNIRIDHCELLGFSYATSFSSKATALVDHCYFHHCPRAGLGYGVAIYSGAKIMVCDNEFSQCRHSLASNGNLDWSSPEEHGMYLHIPEPSIDKTHWEFIHNLVHYDDETQYRLCRVDTHPGMDGTFVIEGNLFEWVRHAIGIRDGAGVIHNNQFKDLSSEWRTIVGISISYGEHNDIPVEDCMPHNIEVAENTFLPEDVVDEKYQIGTAVNITIDGELVEDTASSDEFELNASSMPLIEIDTSSREVEIIVHHNQDRRI